MTPPPLELAPVSLEFNGESGKHKLADAYIWACWWLYVYSTVEEIVMHKTGLNCRRVFIRVSQKGSAQLSPLPQETSKVHFIVQIAKFGWNHQHLKSAMIRQMSTNIWNNPPAIIIWRVWGNMIIKFDEKVEDNFYSIFFKEKKFEDTQTLQR